MRTEDTHEFTVGILALLLVCSLPIVFVFRLCTDPCYTARPSAFVECRRTSDDMWSRAWRKAK